MEKRYIGGTDLEVSVLCYGPMRLAQDQDDPNLNAAKLDRIVDDALRDLCTDRIARTTGIDDP